MVFINGSELFCPQRYALHSKGNRNNLLKNEKSRLSERGNTCEPLSLQHENETNEKTEYTFYSAGLVPAVRYDAGCTDP